MPSLDDHLNSQRALQERRGTRRSISTAREHAWVDLASNDYLGLSRHPAVVAAARTALEEHGTTSGGSRVLAGNLVVHDALDASLRELLGTASVVSTSSGYLANLAAVTALCPPDAWVVADEHAHASLVDGARLARVPLHWLEHNDPAHLETILTDAPEGSLVIVESLYSALGDAAPLPELLSVCQRHRATLLVDEAHAVGVLGDGRGGLAAHGLSGEAGVVATGALGKACASQGGFVAGPAQVVSHIVAAARPFIYDTAMAPAVAAAGAAAVQLIAGHPELVAALACQARSLAEMLGQGAPEGAIISVPLGSQQAEGVVERARQAGILLGCFRPGSTPDGRHRLRITAHAGISTSDLVRVKTFLNTVHPEQP